MRIEILGCSCDSTWRHSDPLGMENLSVLDSQLTASSSQYYNATASNARLNFKTNLSSYGAWIAAENDNNPWLQVDFIANVTITAIATQGLEGRQHWVKEYSIDFGPDNILFTNYKENGETKIFPANFDSRYTKGHDIYPNIFARFVRVKPTSCVGYCALRVEFYGRYEACEIKRYLGMENHEIRDSQITASSVFDNNIKDFRASLARINLTSGVWIPKPVQNQWLQVDFLLKRFICAVLTQGRPGYFEFVITYSMQESSDGLNFVEYKDRGMKKIFQANFDMNTIVRQRLQRVVFARFVRIYPKTWNAHAAMRIEFEGCGKAADDWFNPVPLGMENGLISALQLTASSAQHPSSGAKNSRRNLNTNPERHGGWIAAENDDNPWLQVDFFTNATITRIDTQGSASSEGRVTSYAISFSTDGISFQEYNEYDKVKVFLANYKENSTVRQDVVPSFIARVLRILPKSWIGNCSLRMEVYGRYEGCRDAKRLGVETNTILDSQFSASSEAGYGVRPATARLNLVADSTSQGAWRPQVNANSWLQVDFLRHTKISLILTQGRNNIDYSVTSYLVSYSTNEVDFQYIKDHAHDRVFQANFDRNTISYNPVMPSIFTRYIRIHPRTWLNNIGLRIEFEGCYCDVHCPDPEALGMESFHISNNQLTSSSSHDKYSRHTNARLNLVSVTGVRSGGWVASHDDAQPWIRIDFRANVTIRAIQTQGREDADEWVASYEVSYGTTSNSYDKFQENGQVKVFPANKDRHSVVTQFVFPPLYGRFVRVEPKTWNGKCSMRLEFLGCHEDCSSPAQPLGMEDNTIRDDQITASSNQAIASKGRLNLPTGNAWRAITGDNHCWFQVDFLMVTKVSGIKTQGEESSVDERYVPHYILSYCNDGFQFLNYTENGRVKIFNGNGDEKSVVMTRLARTIFSRFVRINPTGWKSFASLRVEFLGCYYGCTYPNVLGMENGQIRDHQISSSSEKNATVSASNARLNKQGAWMALPDDEAYLQVDFLYRTIVVSVTTQGFADGWASNYYLAYKDDLTYFLKYKVNGVIKLFTANTDPETPVTNFLSPFITARQVRVHLETSSPLRVEFNGCYEDVDICSSLPCLNGGTCVDIFDFYNSFTCVCLPGFTGVYCESECLAPRSLGMVNDRIRDYQITSSSTDRDYSYLANPFEARINNTIFSRCGCWSPQSNSISEWLQVDFLKQIAVTAVQTQGRNSVDEWITQYQISFSQDGTNFVHLMDGDGNIQNFTGNSDRTSIVTRTLSPKVVARFIRIHPTSWFTEIALRAEFIGCYTDMTCLFPRPLGMQNGQIKDAQLSSSSVKPYLWDSLHFTTANSRLHSPETVRWNFWLPLETDTNKWLQVDFIANVTISAIQTQGRYSRTHWVKSYTISYGYDSSGLVPYEEFGITKIFTGNTDTQTVVTNEVSPVIFTQYIRIHPTTCETRCGLRADFIGCYEDIDTCESSPCQNNSTCQDYFDFYNIFKCICTPGYTGEQCETEIDECLYYPCLHNGTCHDFVNFYNCSCTRDYNGTNCEHEIIYPITNIFLLPLVSVHKFGESILVEWDMDEGTRVSVVVHYNGVPCCNVTQIMHVGGQCNCAVSDPNLFDADGLVDIEIHASNPVSHEIRSIPVEIQKVIENPSISMLTSYSIFGSGVHGRGSLQNVFPAEYPVKITSQWQYGPPKNATWIFDCSISGITLESQLNVDKTFPNDQSQQCAIKLILKNSFSEVSTNRSIVLKESVILDSVTNDGPVKLNKTMTFTISLQKLGLDTCMWVDLGDNSSLLVYGEASCETKINAAEINPNIMEEPRLKFFPKNSDTQQIVITHVYPRFGSYDVRLNASNDVSMATESLVAVVLALECRNPNVTITGLFPNNSNLLNAVQVYRSSIVMLSTENGIDCEITQNTKVIWTVRKFDDDIKAFSNIPGLSLADLPKSIFQAEITTADLLLPSRNFPYGFYEISVRLEMEGLPDVFGSNSFYIEVVQTPWLEASVTSGSFYTVPYGLMGSLNASSSVDPDFLGTDGMSFSWYCRDVDDNEFLLPNLDEEPLIAIPEVDEDTEAAENELGGCFGTGRGRLNSTGFFVELDTRAMIEDKTYTISLVISTDHPEFGPREDITNIFFYVAKGLPPGIKTSCKMNCMSKINTDEKIILKSSCDARCYGELTFLWSLYLYDDVNMPEPYNLTELNEIPREEFEIMTSNPIDELDLAIKPNSLKENKKYIAAFQAIRPSGVFGELRYTLLMNSPPERGNCSIFPHSGIALETNFTITCQDWVDPDPPLTIEFTYIKNGARVIFAHQTVASGEAATLVDRLPVGDVLTDFKLNISVLVLDVIGSKSEYILTVQVRPPPQMANMAELGKLMSAYYSSLEQLLDAGLSQQAISFSSSLGILLNLDNNSTAADSQQQEKIFTNMRLKILEQLVRANITVGDILSLKQQSMLLNLITEKTDELLPKALDSSITLCNSLTQSLKKLSDGDAGFKNTKNAASTIVGTLGQIISKSSGNAKNLSSSDLTHLSEQVKSSMALLNTVQDVLLGKLVTSEGPLTLKTPWLSIQVEKVKIKSIGGHKNTLGKCGFAPPSPQSLGFEEVTRDPNNTILQMQPLSIKMAVMKDNSFTWDKTSENMASNVVDIVMESNLNMSSSNFTEEAFIKVARDASKFPPVDAFYLKPSEENHTTGTKEFLKYHCLTRNSNFTSINFELQPQDIGIKLVVYMKKGGRPNIGNGEYDRSFELPDLSSCEIGHNNEQVSNHSTEEDLVYVVPSNCSRNPYTLFVSNTDLNGTGEYCFAIQYLSNLNKTDDKMASRRRRSVSCEVGAKRVRRSCVIIPTPPPKTTNAPPIEILVADNLGFDGKFFFPNQTPNYNLTMFESSCMHWNVVNESWTGEGCRVALGTNKEQINCYCNHLTSFGSDLLVAPNPIDFDSAFKNFGSLAENVAVLALISTILGLYIIGVVWARRADKRDLSMVGPTILSKPKGSYHYLITTYTGSRQGAGTTARVVFTMNGEKGETEPVRLRDRHRPFFERGQENAFVVSYPEGVGELIRFKIWHDNSGSSPSWYLSRVLVKDLQTGETWPLFCENWLAVESNDGEVCRVLHVASEEETINFGHLFSTRAIKGLADGHIWFSIVSRPPTSNFTRVQRLSCALCLLCCTMITSAMFYNMGGQGPSPFAVHLGSLVIDLKPFVIGLQSSIIIVPVNVLIVQIFRNLRPKEAGISEIKKVQNGKQEEKGKASKGRLPHWFIYIAYAICYLASGASIFFTLLYSIQWGKETSTEWVVAMVTSFLQSVLLLQPIKVVVMAIVFALIIRKPTDTEEKQTPIHLPENRSSEIIPKKKKMKKFYSPPDPKTLREARRKRLKEIKMDAALTEIFAFFVFLILLMDVAQYHRNPNTFLLTKTLFETFEEVDAYGIDLSSVSDVDSLWMWSRETLIPGLYSNIGQSNNKSKKGWLANMEVYLVGVPRIRLLRIKKDSCTVPNLFEDIIPHCYGGYSMLNQDERDYGVSWLPLPNTASRKRRDILPGTQTELEWFDLLKNGTDEKSRKKRAIDPIQGGTSGKKRRKKHRLLSSGSPKTYRIKEKALLSDGRILSCLERWRHQTMLELRGFPYWGTISMYSGGGYAGNLGYDQETAYTVVADLHSNGWLNVQTRAVFVEFTVYNANTNLFGMLSIFIEFPPSSGAVTKVQYESARFYLQLTGGQTLAHVLVIFFMIYFLYREIKLLRKQRWAYFKGFWNWIEVILILSEFLLIVFFLARLYEVDRNLLQLRENPNDYVGFQYAGNVDALMTYVIGVLVFFYILRFLRLLRFNKNFLVIGKTLSRISAPILNFCVPFIFGFFAFALFAFSVFSSELEDYSSFSRTLVTQLSMTLGDFDFEALFMVNPVLATLYFFSFIGLNVMVLMNMFVAIINDSYAEIQEETSEIENELEILEHVNEKYIKGVYRQLRRVKVSPENGPKKKRKRKKKVQNVESDEPYIAELNSREEKLSKLVETANLGLEQDEALDIQFCGVPDEKKDVFFRVLCLMELIDGEDESDDEQWESTGDESNTESMNSDYI